MKKQRYSMLPFSVIQAATGGDTEAIDKVLRHYAGYIAKLSMRQRYDENGNPHWDVDKTIRLQLENKLIATVLKFRVA